MKLYKDVLQTGWKQAIHRPNLWVLGFFAILFFGVAGEIDRYIRVMTNLLGTSGTVATLSLQDNNALSAFLGLITKLSNGNVDAWVFTIVTVFAAGVFVYVAAVAQGAIISAAHKNDSAKNDGTTLRSVMRVGYTHAWHLLVVQFVNVGVVLLVSFVSRNVILLSYNVGGVVLATVTIIIMALVLLLFVLYISYLTRYTALYIVTESVSLLDAVKKAHHVVRTHWAVNIEMSFAVLATAVTVNVGIILSIIISLAPFAAISYSLADSANKLVVYYNALFVGGVVYVIALIVGAMIFSVWQWSAWVALFDHLQKERPTAKIVRALKGN